METTAVKELHLQMPTKLLEKALIMQLNNCPVTSRVHISGVASDSMQGNLITWKNELALHMVIKVLQGGVMRLCDSKLECTLTAPSLRGENDSYSSSEGNEICSENSISSQSAEIDVSGSDRGDGIEEEETTAMANMNKAQLTLKDGATRKRKLKESGVKTETKRARRRTRQSTKQHCNEGNQDVNVAPSRSANDTHAKSKTTRSQTTVSCTTVSTTRDVPDLSPDDSTNDNSATHQECDSSETTKCVLCQVAINTATWTAHLEMSHKLTLVKYLEVERELRSLSTDNPAPSLLQKYTESICGLCGKTFNSKQVNGFKMHVTKVHGISFSDYKKVLRLPMKERQDVLLEMQGKLEESQSRYSCPADSCSSVYSHIGNLQQHVRSKHKNDVQVAEELERLVYETSKIKSPTVIACVVCGQMRGGTAIAHHMKTVHSELPNFQELLAQMKDNYKEALKMKRRQYERAYQRQAGRCKYCDLAFNSKYPLARHRLVCANNPNRKKYLRCKLCDYGAWHQETLDAHIAKRHEGVPATDQSFTCQLCGVSYNRLSSLTSHMKTKHHVSAKGPVKPYACPVCDKQFYYQGPFKDHLAVHSDVRDHVCAQCGKAFKTKRDLADHIKHVHQERYPFHCDRCGHGVQQKRYLAKHICGRVKRKQKKETAVHLATEESSNRTNQAFDKADVANSEGMVQKRTREASPGLDQNQSEPATAQKGEVISELSSRHLNSGSLLMHSQIRPVGPDSRGNQPQLPSNTSQAPPIRGPYAPHPTHSDNVYFFNVYSAYNQSGDPQLKPYDSNMYQQ